MLKSAIFSTIGILIKRFMKWTWNHRKGGKCGLNCFMVIITINRFNKKYVGYLNWN